MAQAAAEKLTLPVRQAFVVQLSTETEVGSEHWAGRVEHVVSGQATHFQSVEELLAFMARMLLTVRAQSREDAREEGRPYTSNHARRPERGNGERGNS